MKKFLVMAVAALSLSLASCSDKAQNNDEASVAIEALQSQGEAEPVIKVYLDGKQLSDAVTRYQRRSSRASG